MKKLFVSAGLVAVGAAALQSAFADDVTSPKYWSVSGTLRGFYDDNYDLTSANQESFGIELLPSVSFHVPLRQTDIGLRYTYGLYYYQERNDISVNPFDQTHQVDFWLDHAFNERWHGSINDTFAAGQEPELLNPNPVLGQPVTFRLSGDNVSNQGTATLTTDWTRLFSTVLTYGNVFYDYDNSYYSAILDSVQENVSLDAQWHIQPETTALVGYRFSWVNFTGDALIPGTVYHSSDRDYRTHYGYVGIQQSFTPNLNAKVEAGASYTDSYADPLNPTTSWAPYANVSLSYTYLPGSYVQLGFTHDVSSTEVVAPDVLGRITQYSEDSVVYLSVNHRITSKLVASAIGRVQYSTFQDGAYSSDDMTTYSLGFNVSYEINQHLSLDTGYNYDNVQTTIPGFAYNRNRVYLGVTANY